MYGFVEATCTKCQTPRLVVRVVQAVWRHQRATARRGARCTEAECFWQYLLPIRRPEGLGHQEVQVRRQLEAVAATARGEEVTTLLARVLRRARRDWEEGTRRELRMSTRDSRRCNGR